MTIKASISAASVSLTTLRAVSSQVELKVSLRKLRSHLTIFFGAVFFSCLIKHCEVKKSCFASTVSVTAFVFAASV